MSQIAIVERYWTEPNCDYDVTFFTQYLVLLYGAHFYIALAMTIESFVRTKELYLLLLSLGIALNWYFNSFLLWAFSEPVPQPLCGVLAVFCIDPASPYNACGTPPWPVPDVDDDDECGAAPLPPCDPCVPCGMPAVEPHLSAFVIISIGIFSMQWRSPHIRMYETVLMSVFYGLVVYSHVYIGFNSPAQVLGGALAGVVSGFFWQMVVFWAAYPNFDRILQWPLVRFMGYTDTFCRSYEPVPGDPAPITVDGKNDIETFDSNPEFEAIYQYEKFKNA